MATSNGSQQPPSANPIPFVTVYFAPGKDLPSVQPDGSIQRFSRADFVAEFAPDADAVNQVVHFGRKHGLIVRRSADPWRLMLGGMPGALERAFDFSMTEHWFFRPVPIPQDFPDQVVAILGQRAAPSAESGQQGTDSSPSDDLVVRGNIGYSPLDLARIYRFPDSKGAGKVAILEGGGSLPEDYAENIRLQGILEQPTVTLRTVDTGVIESSHADGEVQMDVQIVATVAPGADQLVLFYGQGFAEPIDALATAVFEPGVTVVSWSWGDFWVSNFPQIFYRLFDFYGNAAACLGVTICIASGDSGAYSYQQPMRPSIDPLAANPWFLACGGSAVIDGTAENQIVWNHNPPVLGCIKPKETSAHLLASGGGFSPHVPLPAWQKSAVEAYPHTPDGAGRGLPDVASAATNVVTYHFQQARLSGGTSAAAPMWAGLIARLNQLLGTPVGFINPLLYANPQALTNIGAPPGLVDSNGICGYGAGWAVAPGWDPCTGLGTPDGEALLKVLRNAKTASSTTPSPTT